jgi:hypothetical protein
MKLDDIRALRDARPFRPFMITLKDGRRLLVEAHCYLGISPKGVVLAVSQERTAWFVPEQVKEAHTVAMVPSY